jgi:hypothetical protein
MSQKHNVFNLKLVKKEGKLVFKSEMDKALYKSFLIDIEEGQQVEVLYETLKDDGTNMQLAKIHVCIKELARDVGYDFAEMKLIVKKNSGLYREFDGTYKSFADCSKEELSSAIETIINLGDIAGINFRGQFPEISQ